MYEERAPLGPFLPFVANILIAAGDNPAEAGPRFNFPGLTLSTGADSIYRSQFHQTVFPKRLGVPILENVNIIQYSHHYQTYPRQYIQWNYHDGVSNDVYPMYIQLFHTLTEYSRRCYILFINTIIRHGLDEIFGTCLFFTTNRWEG